jgi:multiple sugar transport system permease protein
MFGDPFDKREFVGLTNYITVLTSSQFWNSLMVTLLFTSTAVALEVLLGFVVALLLSQGLRGERLFRIILIFPLVTTPVVVGLTWRALFNNQYGIINYYLGIMGLPTPNWLGDIVMGFPSVVLVDCWQWTPFTGLILLAGLQALPRAPYEAAMIDGASRLQIFRSITLPLLRPAIIVAIVFRGVDAFKTFDNIYVLTQGGPGSTTDVLSFLAYRTGFWFFRMGESAAIAILMLICSTILTTLSLRFLWSEMGQ